MDQQGFKPGTAQNDPRIYYEVPAQLTEPWASPSFPLKTVTHRPRQFTKTVIFFPQKVQVSFL
jgi:hypothetical protein